MIQTKTKYNYIRKKNYLFYSPSLVIDYLYYNQNRNSYNISKSEYRKFKRYNFISKNLKKIFFFYYSHKIQIDKINKGKSLFDFYYFGKDQTTKQDITINKPTTKDKIMFAIDKNNFSFSIRFNKTKPKPYIIIKNKFGLLWVSLKISTLKKLNKFMYPEYMINNILEEIETLITEQTKNRKDYIKQLFKFS